MNQIEPLKAETIPDRPVKVRRPPGPSSQAKIARIVAAARKLFAENGYDVTSMEAIAREARVGKATVYAHFTCKEELFASIVTIEGEAHFVRLTLENPLSVAEDLHEFGCTAFALLIAPENTAIVRMVAAESNRFPDLGRIFFETGPSRLVERVAQYLEKAHAIGELAIPDSKLAALQFLALITAEVRLAALLGVMGPIDDETARKTVHAGVEVFLKAYRAKPAPDSAPPARASAPPARAAD